VALSLSLSLTRHTTHTPTPPHSATLSWEQTCCLPPPFFSISMPDLPLVPNPTPHGCRADSTSRSCVCCREWLCVCVCGVHQTNVGPELANKVLHHAKCAHHCRMSLAKWIGCCACLAFGSSGGGGSAGTTHTHTHTHTHSRSQPTAPSTSDNKHRTHHLSQGEGGKA
jgi:hypothetical protein